MCLELYICIYFDEPHELKQCEVTKLVINQATKINDIKALTVKKKNWHIRE